MDNFDKLKNKLRDEHTELPDDLSWDNMADAIVGTDKSSNTRAYWLFAIMLGLGISGGLWLVFHKTTSTPIADVNQTLVATDQADLPTHISDQATSISSTNSGSAGYTQLAASSAASAITNGTPSNPEVANVRVAHESSSSLNRNNSSQVNEYTKVPQLAINTDSAYTSSATIAVVNKSELATTTKSLVNELTQNYILNDLGVKATGKVGPLSKGEEIQTIEDTQPMAFAISQLPSLASGITQEFHPISMELAQQVAPNIEKNTTNQRWSMSLGSSAILWSSSKAAAFPDAYTSNIWSNRMDAAIGYDITKYLSIQSGIGLVNLYSKLEHTTREFQQRTIENTLLYYSEDPISGKLTEVHGDANVIDTLTTYVRHYNKHRVWRLPVSVTVHQNLGPWHIGVSGGLAATILTQYEGKYFENEAFTLYDTSSKRYDQTITPNLTLGLSVERMITPTIFVKGTFTSDFNLRGNQPDGSVHQLKTQDMGIGLHLGKRF